MDTAASRADHHGYDQERTAAAVRAGSTAVTPGDCHRQRALMVLVGAVAVGALHHFYGGGTEQDSAGRDMVRTAGTLVVGVGGFFALLLAARRQRSTEQTLEHQREVAATTARDAVEQRITELYTRAVDQLGSEKAPVRLGGLHALERLV